MKSNSKIVILASEILLVKGRLGVQESKEMRDMPRVVHKAWLPLSFG